VLLFATFMVAKGHNECWPGVVLPLALLLVMRVPTKAEGESGLIVLSLSHILRASVVETENFVVHILPEASTEKPLAM
jgi:hypothetical protein